jgi:membrane peptidoglycan carboxypeptidase
VRLLDLAGAYRAMASGILAEPHIIDRVNDASGEVLYEAARTALELDSSYLQSVVALGRHVKHLSSLAPD